MMSSNLSTSLTMEITQKRNMQRTDNKNMDNYASVNMDNLILGKSNIPEYIFIS
jgi:hypothetical protein